MSHAEEISHDGEYKNITSSSQLGGISFGRVRFYSVHTECDSLTGWRESIYRVKRPSCQSVPWWLCESASSAASVFTVPSLELWKGDCFSPQRQKCPWVMILSTYSRPSVKLFYKIKGGNRKAAHSSGIQEEKHEPEMMEQKEAACFMEICGFPERQENKSYVRLVSRRGRRFWARPHTGNIRALCVSHYRSGWKELVGSN